MSDAPGEISAAAAYMQLEKRLAGVESELVMLREIIVGPELPKSVPSGLRRKAFIGTPESALKMRVAKAAKRNGMSYDAWVAKHGADCDKSRP